MAKSNNKKQLMESVMEKFWIPISILLLFFVVYLSALNNYSGVVSIRQGDKTFILINNKEAMQGVDIYKEAFYDAIWAFAFLLIIVLIGIIWVWFNRNIKK